MGGQENLAYIIYLLMGSHELEIYSFSCGQELNNFILAQVSHLSQEVQ